MFMATVLANNFLLHTQHTQSNTSIPPDFVGGESCIHSFIFVDELLLTRTGSFEVSLEKKIEKNGHGKKTIKNKKLTRLVTLIWKKR